MKYYSSWYLLSSLDLKIIRYRSNEMPQKALAVKPDNMSEFIPWNTHGSKKRTEDMLSSGYSCSHWYIHSGTHTYTLIDVIKN